MKKLKINIPIILVLLLVISVSLVNAQEVGTGLEAEKPEIFVYVKSNTENSQINISEDLIKSKVESRLMQNNIKVLNNSLENDYYLYITLKTSKINSDKNIIYNIGVQMIRVTFYSFNDAIYSKQAVTWSGGGFGKGDSDFIINSLENYTDIFITEFYKANNFKFN
jgi:hypothetical protein